MNVTIDKYVGIHIEGAALPVVRPFPHEVKEAYVLHWEGADVVIPWPIGMTAREAIIAWAKEEPANATITT